MTPLDFRSVTQAALDVAIERLTTLHPARQLFIFGEKGEPFWVLDAERSLFAVVLISPARRLPGERHAPQAQLRA